MALFEQLEQGRCAQGWEPEQAYDSAATLYDKWPWQKVWRSVDRDVVDLAARSRRGTLRILDVGCGTGTLLGRISETRSGAELVGIDISRGMLEQASRKLAGHSIKFIHDDFLDSHLQERSFDLVFMCRVASHIFDLKHCFQKVALSMKNGGTFVLSDVYSRHPYEYTRLPISGGKISVATCKHGIPEIVKTAYDCSLIVNHIRGCSVAGLPEDVKSDPELPRTLASQLGIRPSVPFGFLMTFSLHA